MSIATHDKHGERIIRKSRASRKKEAKNKPKDFVRRIADLPDGHEAVLRSLLSRARAAVDYRESFEDEWREGWYAWMQVLNSSKDEAGLPAVSNDTNVNSFSPANKRMSSSVNSPF